MTEPDMYVYQGKAIEDECGQNPNSKVVGDYTLTATALAPVLSADGTRVRGRGRMEVAWTNPCVGEPCVTCGFMEVFLEEGNNPDGENFNEVDWHWCSMGTHECLNLHKGYHTLLTRHWAPEGEAAPDDCNEWADEGHIAAQGMYYRSCVQVADRQLGDTVDGSTHVRVCGPAHLFPDEFPVQLEQLDLDRYAISVWLTLGGVDVDGGGLVVLYGKGPIPIGPLGWRRLSPEAKDTMLATAFSRGARLFSDIKKREIIEEATASILAQNTR